MEEREGTRSGRRDITVKRSRRKGGVRDVDEYMVVKN